MAGVNKVILVGRLGKDPQLDYTQAGTARCRFSLATSEQYTDRDGQRQEKTEWHNIVLWDKLAEVAGEYLKKGRQVYIEGSIRTRQYQDKEGQTKYISEIIARQMQLLGGPAGERGAEEAPPPAEASGAGPSGRKPPRARGAAAPQEPEEGAVSENDDDLPF